MSNSQQTSQAPPGASILPPPNVYITANDPSTHKAYFHTTEKASWDIVFPNSASMATIYTTNNNSISSGLVETDDIEQHHHLLANPKSQDPPLGIVNPLGTVCRILDHAPLSVSPMHRTMTMDYVVIIEGEMELTLDSGEKRVARKGDMVVQRGTMHSWRNPSETEWSRAMYVMIGLGAEGTVTVGGKKLVEEFGDSGH